MFFLVILYYLIVNLKSPIANALQQHKLYFEQSLGSYGFNEAKRVIITSPGW